MNVKDNLPYFGISYSRDLRAATSLQGKIERCDTPSKVTFLYKEVMLSFNTMLKYHLNINSSLTKEEEVPILFHELGHFFCHHLTPPDSKWWQDRSDLDEKTKEFEAETVSYIVCNRIGLKGDRFKDFLSQNLTSEGDIPPDVSLDIIMMAADSIEEMMAPVNPSNWLLYKKDPEIKKEVDTLKKEYLKKGEPIPRDRDERRQKANKEKSRSRHIEKVTRRTKIALTSLSLIDAGVGDLNSGFTMVVELPLGGF